VVVAGNPHEWKKWNQFNKALRAHNCGFPESAGLLFDAHRSWVNRLAEYRAWVYHEKTDCGPAEYNHNFERGGVDLEFFVPDEATKLLFKGEERVELVGGLAIMARKSFALQVRLLKSFLAEKP
jgi:hypothetical protein